LRNPKPGLYAGGPAHLSAKSRRQKGKKKDKRQKPLIFRDDDDVRGVYVKKFNAEG